MVWMEKVWVLFRWRCVRCGLWRVLGWLVSCFEFGGGSLGVEIPERSL
jgi:hypothetical protein